FCQRVITHTRTITVSPAPFPTYTNPPGNITLQACTANAPNPSTLNYSNGESGFCELSGSVQSTIQLTSGAAPCERIYTETWTTTVCNQPLTHSRTITVPAGAPASFSSAPGNISITCGQAPPSPTLLSYSNGVAGACAISGTVTSTI